MGLSKMIKNRQNGFTLVELMVVVLISGILMGATYSFYRSQQRSYIAQEDVAEMQQELRAAMEIMTREIRNAGHDEDPSNSAGAGFTIAGPYETRFTMDLTNDPGTGGPDGDTGDANENVRFRFAPASDANGDGIADSGADDLGRESGAGGLQALSSNIQAVGFAYAYDDNDADGRLETNAASGEVIWAVPDGGGGWIDLDSNNDGMIDENDPTPAGVGLATATQRQEIRAVRVWILARTSRVDQDYTDTNTFKVGANLIPAANDNFRRRLLSINIRCRNMGLQ